MEHKDRGTDLVALSYNVVSSKHRETGCLYWTVVYFPISPSPSPQG